MCVLACILLCSSVLHEIFVTVEMGFSVSFFGNLIVGRTKDFAFFEQRQSSCTYMYFILSM